MPTRPRLASGHNNNGKTTFFGNDKWLKSDMKFEEKLKGTLLAMTMDGLVSRTATSNEFRETLETVVDAWFEIFPNWPDAKIFSEEKIFATSKAGNQLISSLIGVK